MSIAYDTGVLVAADRNDRMAWADHKARLELGLVPIVTAPVVAQASRSPRQAPLRRILRGCQVVGFDAGQAEGVGALLGKSGTADVVDGHLAWVASERDIPILTGDVDDFRVLGACTQPRLAIRPL
jgi:predicted nucleic acid-binding protein